jgi:hypothetical protein
VINPATTTPRFETKEAAYQPGSPTILILKESKGLVATIIVVTAMITGVLLVDSGYQVKDKSSNGYQTFY